jgi:FtsP/CotA-like multicopper oxidase with cupredoxin domain
MERRRYLLGLVWVMAIAVLISAPAFGAFYAYSPQGGASGAALQKFVNGLPGLRAADKNNLGQYIPVAVPDTGSFPGSDYYVIGVKDYREQMHSSLPAAGTHLRGYYQKNGGDPNPHYLGPIIVAFRDRPVRLLVVNELLTGAAGHLFLPADPSLMGAMFFPGDPLNPGFPAGFQFITGVGNPYVKDTTVFGYGFPDMNMGTTQGIPYTQNRIAIHLHGGATPWISDGTPHQWFGPAGESNPNGNRGASFQSVPDMGAVADGTNTYFYTNQQSGRLMFYHDHAVAITHYNVYAGMAAGYILHDPVEDGLITAGVIPSAATMNLPYPEYNFGIPLVIQDKTFVPNNIATQDPAWNPAAMGFPAGTGVYGDLWIPHVYEPNQSPQAGPNSPPDGRWDYGPWVFGFAPNGNPYNSGLAVPFNAPPMVPLPGLHYTPIPSDDLALGGTVPFNPANPGATPDAPQNFTTSTTPEAIMDTPIVNGTAYPFLNVQPRRYRFRILNACNDRFLNLQLYFAADGGNATGTGGSGAKAIATVSGGAVTAIKPAKKGKGKHYKTPPGVFITGGGGYGAKAHAVLKGKGKKGSPVASYVVDTGGTGYSSAPTITVGSDAEVKLALAPALSGIPTGVVPDPTSVGPQFIQIGNEGGILPAPVVLNDPANVLGQNPNRDPIYLTYQLDRRQITALNVLNKNLFLGPAERADVIVDFSGCPVGSKLILYNDAPAPVPGIDTRYDLFTSTLDYTSPAGNPFGASGGPAQTQVGFGPNTRTIMQFRVVANSGTADTNAATNLAALANQATGLPNAFTASQPTPLVPPNDPTRYGSVSDPFSTKIPVNGISGPPYISDEEKDVNEQFDMFGRMNATLAAFNLNPAAIVHGVPILGTIGAYVDPPQEIFNNGETQVWKFVHNGVDTHAIHFHLFNVQVINRADQIGGVVSGPDPNEMGWKETVRMNPLEIVWVAMKPVLPTLPGSFGGPLPHSVRPQNPSMSWGNSGPAVAGFAGGFSDPTFSNIVYDFNHEYVFHCHLLGHEENDMMRAVQVNP